MKVKKQAPIKPNPAYSTKAEELVIPKSEEIPAPPGNYPKRKE